MRSICRAFHPCTAPPMARFSINKYLEWFMPTCANVIALVRRGNLVLDNCCRLGAEMKVLARGWHKALEALAANAKRELVVCSPFVGCAATELLMGCLTPGFRKTGSITFITDLSPSNICQRSTDPWALRGLRDHANSAVIRHLPAVHAKVYVADDEMAIVGSGNLTAGGLYRNFEVLPRGPFGPNCWKDQARHPRLRGTWRRRAAARA